MDHVTTNRQHFQLHYNSQSTNLLVSHKFPIQSGGHTHVNKLIPSIHSAEFLHGLLEHSSKSVGNEEKTCHYWDDQYRNINILVNTK